MTIGPKNEQMDFANLDLVVRAVYNEDGDEITVPGGAQAAATAAPTFTATSGSLPTANGALTVADATTPTVVELLEGLVELRATLVALIATVDAMNGH